MSTIKNLEAFTGQDWICILNYAMHLGGITEVVITEETLKAFKDDPTSHRYMNVGRLESGGLVFQATHVATQEPESLGRTLN